ncbi:hypothetical protein SAMN05216551_1181, partial [Chitinasiproducens palmae]
LAPSFYVIAAAVISALAVAAIGRTGWLTRQPLERQR